MTNWVIDLDGVMWRGPEPVDGSVESVGELLSAGDRVLFCTNNSVASGQDRAVQLADRGVPAGAEVVTSADAVCTLLTPGERVLVLGSRGLVDVLRSDGAEAVSTMDRPSSAGFGAVVVGLTRDFDYHQIDLAMAAVRSGARLLGTNADATFPGSDGIHVGTGALLAAVETATGTEATVAGKPNEPIAALIRKHFDGALGETVVVGDRPGTDGRLAQRLGVPFLLVLSGVTGPEDPTTEVPTAEVAADLATLVRSGAGERHR